MRTTTRSTARTATRTTTNLRGSHYSRGSGSRGLWLSWLMTRGSDSRGSDSCGSTSHDSHDSQSSRDSRSPASRFASHKPPEAEVLVPTFVLLLWEPPASRTGPGPGGSAPLKTVPDVK
ncbi:hypothetical protein DICA0_E19966 [Diutina catenulata]